MMIGTYHCTTWYSQYGLLHGELCRILM